MADGCEDRHDQGKQFVGKWKPFKSENFDEWLKSIGVPYLIRKAISFTSSIVDIRIDEEGYFIYSTSTFSLYEIRFKFDEEFDEIFRSPYGSESFKAIISVDDKGRWIHKQLRDNPCEYIREVNGDEMIQTLKHKDVVAYRYYKRN